MFIALTEHVLCKLWLWGFWRNIWPLDVAIAEAYRSRESFWSQDPLKQATLASSSMLRLPIQMAAGDGTGEHVCRSIGMFYRFCCEHLALVKLQSTSSGAPRAKYTVVPIPGSGKLFLGVAQTAGTLARAGLWLSGSPQEVEGINYLQKSAQLEGKLPASLSGRGTGPHPLNATVSTSLSSVFNPFCGFVDECLSGQVLTSPSGSLRDLLMGHYVKATAPVLWLCVGKAFARYIPSYALILSGQLGDILRFLGSSVLHTTNPHSFVGQSTSDVAQRRKYMSQALVSTALAARSTEDWPVNASSWPDVSQLIWWARGGSLPLPVQSVEESKEPVPSGMEGSPTLPRWVQEDVLLETRSAIGATADKILKRVVATRGKHHDRGVQSLSNLLQAATRGQLPAELADVLHTSNPWEFGISYGVSVESCNSVDVHPSHAPPQTPVEFDSEDLLRVLKAAAHAYIVLPVITHPGLWTLPEGLKNSLFALAAIYAKGGSSTNMVTEEELKGMLSALAHTSPALSPTFVTAPSPSMCNNPLSWIDEYNVGADAQSKAMFIASVATVCSEEKSASQQFRDRYESTYQRLQSGEPLQSDLLCKLLLNRARTMPDSSFLQGLVTEIQSTEPRTGDDSPAKIKEALTLSFQLCAFVYIEVLPLLQVLQQIWRRVRTISNRFEPPETTLEVSQMLRGLLTGKLAHYAALYGKPGLQATRTKSLLENFLPIFSAVLRLDNGAFSPDSEYLRGFASRASNFVKDYNSLKEKLQELEQPGENEEVVDATHLHRLQVRLGFLQSILPCFSSISKLTTDVNNEIRNVADRFTKLLSGASPNRGRGGHGKRRRVSTPARPPPATSQAEEVTEHLIIPELHDASSLTEQDYEQLTVIWSQFNKLAWGRFSACSAALMHKLFSTTYFALSPIIASAVVSPPTPAILAVFGDVPLYFRVAVEKLNSGESGMPQLPGIGVVVGALSSSNVYLSSRFLQRAMGAIRLGHATSLSRTLPLVMSHVGSHLAFGEWRPSTESHTSAFPFDRPSAGAQNIPTWMAWPLIQDTFDIVVAYKKLLHDVSQLPPPPLADGSIPRRLLVLESLVSRCTHFLSLVAPLPGLVSPIVWNRNPPCWLQSKALVLADCESLAVVEASDHQPPESFRVEIAQGIEGHTSLVTNLIDMLVAIVSGAKKLPDRRKWGRRARNQHRSNRKEKVDDDGEKNGEGAQIQSMPSASSHSDHPKGVAVDDPWPLQVAPTLVLLSQLLQYADITHDSWPQQAGQPACPWRDYRCAWVRKGSEPQLSSTAVPRTPTSSKSAATELSMSASDESHGMEETPVQAGSSEAGLFTPPPVGRSRRGRSRPPSSRRRKRSDSIESANSQVESISGQGGVEPPAHPSPVSEVGVQKSPANARKLRRRTSAKGRGAHRKPASSSAIRANEETLSLAASQLEPEVRSVTRQNLVLSTPQVRMLVRVCLHILRTENATGHSTHGAMLVLKRLMKWWEGATEFLRAGGTNILLSMGRQNHFQGQTGLAAAIFRKVEPFVDVLERSSDFVGRILQHFSSKTKRSSVALPPEAWADLARYPGVYSLAMIATRLNIPSTSVFPMLARIERSGAAQRPKPRRLNEGLPALDIGPNEAAEKLQWGDDLVAQPPQARLVGLRSAFLSTTLQQRIFEQLILAALDEYQVVHELEQMTFQQGQQFIEKENLLKKDDDQSGSVKPIFSLSCSRLLQVMAELMRLRPSCDAVLLGPRPDSHPSIRRLAHSLQRVALLGMNFRFQRAAFALPHSSFLLWLLLRLVPYSAIAKLSKEAADREDVISPLLAAGFIVKNDEGNFGFQRMDSKGSQKSPSTTFSSLLVGGEQTTASSQPPSEGDTDMAPLSQRLFDTRPNTHSHEHDHSSAQHAVLAAMGVKNCRTREVQLSATSLQLLKSIALGQPVSSRLLAGSVVLALLNTAIPVPAYSSGKAARLRVQGSGKKKATRLPLLFENDFQRIVTMYSLVVLVRELVRLAGSEAGALFMLQLAELGLPATLEMCLTSIRDLHLPFVEITAAEVLGALEPFNSQWFLSRLEAATPSLGDHLKKAARDLQSESDSKIRQSDPTLEERGAVLESLFVADPRILHGKRLVGQPKPLSPWGAAVITPQGVYSPLADFAVRDKRLQAQGQPWFHRTSSQDSRQGQESSTPNKKRGHPKSSGFISDAAAAQSAVSSAGEWSEVAAPPSREEEADQLPHVRAGVSQGAQVDISGTAWQINLRQWYEDVEEPSKPHSTGSSNGSNNAEAHGEEDTGEVQEAEDDEEETKGETGDTSMEEREQEFVIDADDDDLDGMEEDMMEGDEEDDEIVPMMDDMFSTTSEESEESEDDQEDFGLDPRALGEEGGQLEELVNIQDGPLSLRLQLVDGSEGSEEEEEEVPAAGEDGWIEPVYHPVSPGTSPGVIDELGGANQVFNVEGNDERHGDDPLDEGEEKDEENDDDEVVRMFRDILPGEDEQSSLEEFGVSGEGEGEGEEEEEEEGSGE